MLMSTDISVRVDASAVFCDNGYVGVRVVEIPIDRKVSEKLIYKLTDPIEDRLREVNNISATFLYPSEKLTDDGSKFEVKKRRKEKRRKEKERKKRRTEKNRGEIKGSKRFHVESLTTCAGVDGDGGGSDGNDGDGDGDGDGGGGGGGGASTSPARPAAAPATATAAAD
uniref:Uncharacterized protein n=1 Tax=Vespula pensylvanica TaxID=30213 RepID=A0A834N1H3_VESPE|nr:hypothetical protein H0235_017359 [Vespula pensylvanica]